MKKATCIFFAFMIYSCAFSQTESMLIGKWVTEGVAKHILIFEKKRIIEIYKRDTIATYRYFLSNESKYASAKGLYIKMVDEKIKDTSESEVLVDRKNLTLQDISSTGKFWTLHKAK